MVNLLMNSPKGSFLKKVYDKNFQFGPDQLSDKLFLKNEKCFVETKMDHFLRFQDSAFLTSSFESKIIDFNNSFLFFNSVP